MARKSSQTNLAHDLHHLFLHVPAYLSVQIGVGILASTNPAFHGFLPSAPLLGYMASGVVLAAGLTAAIKKAERRQLHDRQRGIESIRELSWVEFEQLVGEAYRRQGYRVTENGGGGADGGIDLILHKEGERLIVQCKQWRVFKVGVKPVRELYGVLMAERADGAIFVTSGTYTQEARDFAAGKPLELLDGESLCRLIEPVRTQPSALLVASAIPVATEGTIALVDVPACPVCQRQMVRRTASKGANAGSQFWGCAAYPKCRGTRRISS